MKQRFIIITLLGCLLSTIAVAQDNVKKAFDKFVTSKHVQVTKSISEERDFTKENRPLIAKADVYNFTINKKHRKLIDEVLLAFEKDRDNPDIYMMLNHTGGQNIPTNARDLVVGEDRKNVVQIGMDEWQSWQLLCLLDPSDITHSHRYAYAIEWNDNPKTIYLSGKIKGKLVITYGRIQKEALHVYQGNVTYPKQESDKMNSEEIVKEIYMMGLSGQYNRLTDKTQVLIAFDALKTEFLKGKATDRLGGTLCMTIYTLCSYARPLLEKAVDLRKKLISDLNMMIGRCDKNSDIGKSHIGYLTLAVKSLQ